MIAEYSIPMNDISDDILIHKIQPLLTIYDIIEVGYVSRKFAKLSIEMLQCVSTVVVKNNMSFSELSRICPRIKHIDLEQYGYNISSDGLDVLSNMKLESMNMADTMSYSHTNHIFPYVKHLKKVKLYRDISSNFPALEILTLHNLPDETALESLKQIKTLKQIIIDDLIPESKKRFVYELPVSSIHTDVTDLIDIAHLPLTDLDIINDYCLNIHLLTKLQLRSLSVNFELDPHLLSKLNLRSFALFHERMIPINVPTLKSLSLSKVDMQNHFNCLSQLSGLNRLIIHECKFQPEHMKDLIGLHIKYLHITSGTVDSETIQKLPLIELRMDNCTFNDIPMYTNSLKTLIINTNRLIASQEIPLTLTSLSIDSRRRYYLPTDMMQRIGQNKHLSTLMIYGYDINDDDMRYLEHLEINYLTLKSTSLTINGIRYIKNMPLRKLDIDYIKPLHLLKV